MKNKKPNVELQVPYTPEQTKIENKNLFIQNLSMPDFLTKKINRRGEKKNNKTPLLNLET